MDRTESIVERDLGSNWHEVRIPKTTLIAANQPGLCRIVQLLFDLFAMTASWYATIALRVLLNPYFGQQLTHSKLAQLAPPLWALLLLWILTDLWLDAQWNGRTQLASRFISRRVSESAIIASVMATVATFFSHGFGADLSRSFIVLFALVSYVFLVVARWAEGAMWEALGHKWPEPRKVALLGDGLDAHLIAERIRTTGRGVIRFAGLILPSNAYQMSERPYPVLGTTQQIAEVINRQGLQQIIVLTHGVPDHDIEQCSRISRRMGVTVSQAVTPAPMDTTFTLTTQYGLQLLEMRPAPLTAAQARAKRVVDVIVSALLLICLSPLLLLVTLLVKLTSPGPVLYRSQRVGKGGRYFTFLKFRSMYYHPEGRRHVTKMNEREGHLFKIRNDPRVTPLGRIMRRYSIDELPQLFNVLWGNMSLLGPRPLPIEDLEPDGMSKEFAEWAELRAKVVPGITGLWQIRGRSNLSFEEMVQLDIEYIRSWSLILDLRILLATPLAVLSGRGAY